ncbi:hypothetical protein DV737_g5266, partial [Chaetothyriales sp. CBS 132003]
MSRARILRPTRVALATLGGVGGSALALYPSRTAFAEAPPSTSTGSEAFPEKKPIYSSYAALAPAPTATPPSTPANTPQPSTPSSSDSSSSSSSSPYPTPTDWLTQEIKRGRLALVKLASKAEDSTNSALTWAFNEETKIANTITSLAPAPETGEKLLPGGIYVLVAALTGSIVSRNRGIFLRTLTPLGVGIAAGWALLPVTMTNVSDLIWEWEKKVPAISEAHIRARDGIVDAWNQLERGGKKVVSEVESGAEGARKGIENWVGKGK